MDMFHDSESKSKNIKSRNKQKGRMCKEARHKKQSLTSNHSSNSDQDDTDEDFHIQQLLHASQQLHKYSESRDFAWTLVSPTERARRRQRQMNRKQNISVRKRQLSLNSQNSDHSQDRNNDEPADSVSNSSAVSSQGTVESSSENTRADETQTSRSRYSSSQFFVNDEDDDNSLFSPGDKEDSQDVDMKQDGFFIQPEGDAKALPRDLNDHTLDISYDKLGAFFDDLVHELKTKRIPAARHKVVKLEQQWSDSSSRKEKEALFEER